MPQSKLHSKFNTLVLLPLLLAAAYFYLSRDLILLGLFAACFLYSTYFAHPDVDLANQHKLFSLNGIMLLPFKLFYAPFFKHRSRISHSILWGTPSRLLVIILFVVLISFLGLMIEKMYYGSLAVSDLSRLGKDLLNIFYFSLKDLYQYCRTHKSEFLAVIAGFYAADFGHLFLDKLSK